MLARAGFCWIRASWLEEGSGVDSGGGTKEKIRWDGMNSSVMFKVRKPRRDGDERDGAEADEEEDEEEEEDRGWETDGG